LDMDDCKTTSTKNELDMFQMNYVKKERPTG
jgi:hypothetical protein